MKTKKIFLFEIVLILSWFIAISQFEIGESEITFFHMAIFFVATAVLIGFYFDKATREISGILLGAFVIPLSFSWIYLILQGNGCLVGSVDRVGRDFIYFSYTTYTTLGYGDITPIGYCRYITSIQAILGYLFMAYDLRP